MGRPQRLRSSRGARAAGAPPRDPDAPASRGTAWLAAALAAAVALVAYRGALDYGFSQDDFLSLARVHGLAPRLSGPWRVLSNQWFWDALVRTFGDAPRAFHAIVLGAHAACAALLALLLARRFPAPAVLLAACVWASHPAHQTALYWISANSDPFLTLFLLLATAAWVSRGASRWLAVPAFAIALAWKESGLLLPLALAALAAWGPAPRRAWSELVRDPVLWALAAVALVWAGAIAAFVNGLGVAGNAYEASAGAIARNLLTDVSWIPWWAPFVQHDLSDDARPAFVRMGAILLALVLLALAWPAWGRRGAPGALVAAALLLAPVLPLAHHTYRYYLHAPLAAAACAGAAFFTALTARLGPTRRWIAALALAAIACGASSLWIAHVEQAPFELPGSRADRTIDRALIASNAIADVAAAALPRGSRLAMWSPQSEELARAAGPDSSAEPYAERNVRAALLDGLALRVERPELAAVRFVRTFAPVDTAERWAVYRPDGHLGVLRAAELARVLSAGPR